MIIKILRIIAKTLLGLVIFLVVVSGLAIAAYHYDQDKFDDYARIFPIFPDKFINTLRFFPHYNPFAKHLDDLSPDISSLKDPNEIIKLQGGSDILKTSVDLKPGVPREVLIYLPKGYDPEKTAQRYPVLYLLHGSPGQATDWVEFAGAKSTLDSAIDNHTIKPLIAVFPDGNGGNNKDSEYINSAQGDSPVEDFITKNLVNYIDSNLLTDPEPESRAIGGLSEGAFGAVNLSLKHQDIFGYALSFSGYGYLPQTPLTNSLINGSQQIIHDNSPVQYVPDLQTENVKILLVAEHVHTTEQDNRDLLTVLQNKGFSVDYLSFTGAHNWHFWTAHLPDGISWLGKYWSAGK